MSLLVSLPFAGGIPAVRWVCVRREHGRRCCGSLSTAGFVALVALGLVLLWGGVERAAAHQSPPGCFRNTLELFVGLTPGEPFAGPNGTVVTSSLSLNNTGTG